MDGGSPQPLQIAVLGPVRAWRDGTPLDLGPVRRQAVLAALVLRSGMLVSHEQLLDDVWGAQPPGSGRRVLPSYVYQLRKALDAAGAGLSGSVIRSGRDGYRFVRDGARLDVAELAGRLGEAQRARASGDLAAALDGSSAACTLFRGEPLAGLPGPFAQGERQRLAQRQRTVRQERLECLVRLGRSPDALDDLAALSASEPYDESLAALWMRALYGSGRQAAALSAYQDLRGRLRDELGVDPGTELRRVHQAVLRRDDEQLLGPAAARPAAVPSGPRPRRVNELPGDIGRLVGRERELALLTASLPPESVSIVTVDGTAGVGKTALVIHAARRISAHYPDGCLFVDLRAHGTGRQHVPPQRVLRRLLRAVGAADSEVPDDLDELTGAWRAATGSLRLLLVVDDALDAQQIVPLLPAGPGSTVLVAGRRRLTGLDADRRVTLEPLEAAEGLSLLRHIVGEERADREPEATRALVRLCDGLPLALRIAGARLQTRPAWTLAYLVDRMAGDEHRLGELSTGDRSVEAAFRLSYDQLTPRQQHGFRALGLSPTVEFDPRTPAAMLGRSAREAEQILESLVDASLVQQPRPGRYRLHDLVRVHARRLAEAAPAEAEAARTAALRLYLDAGRTTSDWGPAGFPTGPQSAESAFTGWQDADGWLDSSGAELVDVVGYAAALGEADYACRLAEALSDYFVRHGRYHECRTALEIALAHADGAGDRRMAAAVRSCLGITEIHQGHYAEGHAWFAEALRLSRHHADPREEARARSGLGAAEMNLGRAEQAMSHLTAAVELAQRLGDDWLAAMGLCLLGSVHRVQGRSDEALACFADARAHAEKNGRPRMISRVLACAADVHLDLGHHTEARTLFRHAADLVQQVGDVLLHSVTLTRLGSAEQNAGNLSAAMALHHQALARHRLLSPLTEPQCDRLEMDIRYRLGRAYVAAGRVAEAREQFRTALAVPGADGHPEERALAIAALNECPEC
ncbi:SARP family transcriptional regulator [Streptomyces albospinus]|uniref:SARP family transcriptional regulator n=1 Tax=Streptomyces albospinus TaxID=285515 RepID=A0ABQ2V7Q5_9ACTN|nr:BTAD domain-containing putative transcriptional regulator [Streptomyces albospinus]GGU71076.1 SARP family transcriptional regulator [Streptomyces albospinus]